MTNKTATKTYSSGENFPNRETEREDLEAHLPGADDHSRRQLVRLLKKSEGTNRENGNENHVKK